MKRTALLTLGALLGIVALLWFVSAAYIVDETEQVVITRFGRPVGKPVQTPGLHFKAPFVEEVHRFEKRVMEWDSDHREIPTKDKKFIQVDATARWRIVDPLQYLQRVGDEPQAQSRLDDIVGGAMKDVISKLDLIESVRSTNRRFAKLEEILTTEYDTEEYEIEVGRHRIGQMIRESCNPNLADFGIELLDVRLRRINYVESVRREVYQRMISERRRMAEFYRSEGAGKQMEIEGQREKKLKEILSAAYKQAEEIRGKADAEAARIYAETYGQDPEFYTFLQTLETYKTALDEGTQLILTTGSDFFRFLKFLEGKPQGNR